MSDPPSAGAVTSIVMAGAAPTARDGRVQVTTPLACPQAQPVPVAERKPTATGRVSVTVRPVAVDGPALAAVSV